MLWWFQVGHTAQMPQMRSKDVCGQELMLLDSVPVQFGKTNLLDCCSLGWYYSSIEHHVPRDSWLAVNEET